MLEAKDPAIKLFGKTIPVAENPAYPGEFPGPGDGCSGPVVDDAMDHDHASSTNSSFEDNTNRDGGEREIDKDASEEKSIETNQKHGTDPLNLEELSNPNSGSGISENPKTLSVEKDNGTLKTTKSEEEQSQTSNPQEKTLKKPDKILPCPRCKSMDTKFCYYNNYNVNQPRHFCKNCQRYWTAGGTMRNVPVGAGRRKNKSSASHYHHITVPEALQSAQIDVGFHPSLKSNGTVLNFGTDTPLCDSMDSVLNLSDKTMRHYAWNGFHKPEDSRIPVSYAGGGESNNDHSNRSSITSTNYMDEACKTGSQEQSVQNCQGFLPHVQCYPGAPWPYPWPSAQCSPPVPLPTLCPPTYPMPFYPTAAYWGCSVPGVWNVPWLPLTPSANQPTPSFCPSSPTLGKHSRDENTHKPNSSGEGKLPKESNPERCLWVPKTLRIDDPGEAAKSSIWATLGIKNDKADSIGGRGLFKAFQTKGDEKNHVFGTSSVLQANPAALSRSVNFQESS